MHATRTATTADGARASGTMMASAARRPCALLLLPTAPAASTSGAPLHCRRAAKRATAAAAAAASSSSCPDRQPQQQQQQQATATTAPPIDGPARALQAILGAVAERDLDALLAFVPDAALDAALALKKRREAEALASGAPRPANLAFADVLEATAATGGGANGWAWTDCGVNGDDEACAVLAEDSPFGGASARGGGGGGGSGSGHGGSFFDDDRGDREAAADAEARGAAGDDGGDAIAGLLQPLYPFSAADDEDGGGGGDGDGAAACGVGGGGRQASPDAATATTATTTTTSGRPAAPRPYLDTFAQRHLVHAAPAAVRVLSAMLLSPTSYRARLALRSVAGEEAVLTFALSRMGALEPRYRGAPQLTQKWFLTGIVGEASSAVAPAPAAAASSQPPAPPPPPPTAAAAAAAAASTPAQGAPLVLPPPSHPSPSFPPEAVVEAQLAALRDGRVAAAFALASPAAKRELGPLGEFAARLSSPDGPLRFLPGHARAATVERMQVSETQYLARVRVLEGGGGQGGAASSADEGDGGAAPVWREFLWVVSRQGADSPLPNCWLTDAIRPLFAPQAPPRRQAF